MEDTRNCVKEDKGAHQEQNGLCGSELRGGPEGKVASVNVLHSLLISVENANHVAAGTKHQQHEQCIRNREKYCIDNVSDLVIMNSITEFIHP